MTWGIDWTEQAKWALGQLHWRTAARVDKAVQDFAATGKGDLARRRSDDHAVTLRLRVKPYVVLLTANPLDRVICVITVYQSGPI